MKRAKLYGILVLLFLAIPSFAFAGGSSSNTCNTKYPVILAHGMGASAEILGVVNYWWGIPDALTNEGCNLYITSVNGMDSTANKAAAFKTQFLQILAVTGASKANIIAHSHGCLYTRYAISNLGLAPKVATWTGLCGPNRGSYIADLVMYGLSDSVKQALGDSLDFIYAYVFGDTNPDSIANGYDVTTNYCVNVFNPNTPNMPGVYYQSWAAKAKISCPNIILEPTWLILLAHDGDNDGLVAVSSAKWGNFRGVEDGAWYSPGVDHLCMVDQLFGITPGFDAPDFYVSMVSELKGWGY